MDNFVIPVANQKFEQCASALTKWDWGLTRFGHTSFQKLQSDNINKLC